MMGPAGRARRRLGPGLLALIGLGLACAHMLAPPGGPPDKTPPHLLASYPESLAVLPGFKGQVEFQFDEVISEGATASMGLGTGDLEKLIILSPSEAVPKVDWKRDRITVRPREGWQPNRVYRVELLPGVTDVSRNRSDSGTVVTFTTGAPAPTTGLSGQTVDWAARKLGAGALVEAELLPDSLRYRTVADTNGRFTLAPLPAGTYLVYAVIDQNKNHRRDAREAFDSARALSDSGKVTDLWMFPRDTVGPRILTITVSDSQSAMIEFSQLLDPYQRFDTSMARLRQLPDSLPVPLRSLLPKPVDDSLQAAARAQSDTSRRADTTKAAPTPVKPAPLRPVRPGRPAPDTAALRRLLSQRPPLTDKLVLRRDTTWTPRTKFMLELYGIRNANGVASDPSAPLIVPEPTRPVAADSTKRQPPTDSLRADTTRGVKPR